MQCLKVSTTELPKDEDLLYQEIQKFTQYWLWGLLIAIVVIESIVFGYGIVKQIIFKEPWGDKPISDLGLILIAVWAIGIPVIIMYLFSITSLETRIYPSGIYIRYFPFHLKYRHIPWDSIEEIVGRKYRPIIEYGGWGLRWNFNSWAYTVSGNHCVELRKGGKKIVLGTQRLGKLMTSVNRAQEIYFSDKSL
ncbi:MAG: DUF6141 family protein [Candidatus Hydrogenedentes bacterium]|nr:DUF6141 family protein [Candidatus Hydrogenedentota bacterium]